MDGPVSRNVLGAVLAGLVAASCGPPALVIKDQMTVDHPGCELKETTDWKSDPSTLYVSVKFQCPQQLSAVETWMYQEQDGPWKRLRADVDPRTGPARSGSNP